MYSIRYTTACTSKYFVFDIDIRIESQSATNASLCLTEPFWFSTQSSHNIRSDPSSRVFTSQPIHLGVSVASQVHNKRRSPQTNTDDLKRDRMPGKKFHWVGVPVWRAPMMSGWHIDSMALRVQHWSNMCRNIFTYSVSMSTLRYATSAYLATDRCGVNGNGRWISITELRLLLRCLPHSFTLSYIQ